MGMFDRIKCEYQLPGLSYPVPIEFQTKDLANYMEDYRITKEGRLLHQTYRTEDHSDPKAKPGSSESITGCMTRIPTGEEDENYSGELNFYGNIQTGELMIRKMQEDGTIQDLVNPNSEPEWFVYVAQFENGTIVKVNRIFQEQGQ